MQYDLIEEILHGDLSSVQAAIAEGADVNQHDQYGYTPLIEAIIKNDFKMVQLLVEKGAKVNANDALGCSPLQWAVDYNQLNCIRYLLSRGADPNHYSMDGQPILANPILRRQEPSLALLRAGGADFNIAKDYIQAKLLGHRFELSGQADIVDDKGQFFEIEFEGFFLEFTLGLIKESLDNFWQANQSPNQLNQYIPQIVKAYHQAELIMQRKFAKRNLQDLIHYRDLLFAEPLILPVAYEGHAIAIIKYGNYLIKCDRGVKKIFDTSIIYEVHAPEKLNYDLLRELLEDQKTDDYLHYKLVQDLKLVAIAKLPTHSQIAGNCSWANIEACMPALMFVMSMPNNASASVLAKHKTEVMSLYSKWLDWDKDRALDACYLDFQQLSEPRQAAKVAILASIFVQRLNPYKTHHVKRGKRILPYLLIDKFQYILQSYIAIYIDKRAGKLGERLQLLLKKCGLEQKSIQNLTHLKAEDARRIRINLPLHIAARNGELEKLKYYLSKMAVDVNLRDETGSTALMYAAWKGHMALVRFLVEQYAADTLISNNKQATAIQYAAYNQHLDVVSYLSKSLNKHK